MNRAVTRSIPNHACVLVSSVTASLSCSASASASADQPLRLSLARLTASHPNAGAADHLTHALAALDVGGPEETKWAAVRCRAASPTWERTSLLARLDNYAQPNPTGTSPRSRPLSSLQCLERRRGPTVKNDNESPPRISPTAPLSRSSRGAAMGEAIPR